MKQRRFVLSVYQGGWNAAGKYSTRLTHCYCLYKHLQNSCRYKNCLSGAVVAGSWSQNIYRIFYEIEQRYMLILQKLLELALVLSSLPIQSVYVDIFQTAHWGYCPHLNFIWWECQDSWVQTWMHLLVMLRHTNDAQKREKNRDIFDLFIFPCKGKVCVHFAPHFSKIFTKWQKTLFHLHLPH